MFASARRPALLAGAILALGVTGMVLVPHGWHAGQLLLARDAPEQLTARTLDRGQLPGRLAVELESALNSADIDLSDSVLELARQEQITLPAELLESHGKAGSTAATARRTAGEFYQGAISGTGQSKAGMAGVITADLTGLGDLRDLTLEGAKMARGEEPDHLVLGLAAIGLVVSGATIASFGAASPARAGVSTIKVAARSGRLSKPLATQLTQLVGDTIDRQAVARAIRAGRRLEIKATRDALRATLHPQALARLGAVAGDVGSITAKAGLRGTQDTLALARNSGEIRRVARLAEARGTSTRAILKLLGRGAIVLGTAALILASWAIGAALWLVIVITFVGLVVRRLVRRAGRKTSVA